MVNGKGVDAERVWQLGDINMKRIYEYKYLGIITLSEKGMDKVMQEKVTKANQLYDRLASVEKYCACMKCCECCERLWPFQVWSIYCINVINWIEKDMQSLTWFRVK